MPLRLILGRTWDDAVHRSWCEGILDHQPDDHHVFYRGRNLLFTAEIAGRTVAVKRFVNRSWFRRLSYRLRSGKALRSFRHAGRLLELGIDTPEPLACIEEWRQGLPTRSAFLCAWLPDCPQIRRAILEPGFPDRLEHLRRVGGLIARLHRAGVLHRDLSAGNILIQRDGQTWRYPLVDLNRMRFLPSIPLSMAIANLVCLETQDEAATALLAGWAEAMGLDPGSLRPRYDAALRRRLWVWAIKNRTRRWRHRITGRT